jgi:hypothetical protein
VLREVYGDDVLSQMITNGSDVLKMEELQWKTVSGLADVQLQDPNL